MYLKEMLLSEKALLLKCFFTLLCSVTFIVIIFMLIRFKAGIPAEYIPYDNVFDFNFYMEKLKIYINSVNLSAGYIPTYIETLHNNSLKIKFILLALAVVSFIFTVSYMKLLHFMDFSKKNFIVVLILSLIAALVLSICPVFFCGIDFCFPLKEVGIICIFFIMKVNLSGGFYKSENIE